MLHHSLQPDLVRIRHAELLSEARAAHVAAQVERVSAAAPPENPLARLQTILTAAGHVPPRTVSTRSLRAAVSAG